jgi:hypothetical protein
MQEMKFRRVKKQKSPNYLRAVLLILVLILVIYFWLNAEGFVAKFLRK